FCERIRGKVSGPLGRIRGLARSGPPATIDKRESGQKNNSVAPSGASAALVAAMSISWMKCATMVLLMAVPSGRWDRR
ncbi:MAG: hypothetical protein AB7U76_26385, partial [Pirellulales bacterium]